MKPNFALNLTDSSIALLHRTPKGWSLVGETPFDAPDLAEALDYMRKTALGLEPGGISTKLVIPNSQILYSEVSAPGPSEEERRSQIAAELEGRTPYKADEIAFDFSGRGKTVKVAAVARETLAEAEAFAVEHRFNPVSFVAMPENGYSGEPWFGPTKAAKAMLSPGEVVERDRNAITLPEAASDARNGAAASTSPAPAPAMSAPPMAAPPMSAPPMAAPPKTAPPRPADPAPSARAPEPAAPEPAAPVPPAEAPKPAAAEAPAPGDAPKTVVADRPAPASPAPASSPAAPAAAERPPMPSAAPLRDQTPAVPPPPPLGVRPAAAASAAAPGPAEPADEAPFTHVPDAEPAGQAGALDDVPPMPAGLASRGAALAGRSVGVAATTLPDEEDDLPPAPSAAALAALNNRRAAAGGLPPGRPDAAALARAARGKPVEDLPPIGQPASPTATPAGPVAGPAAAGAVSGLKPVVRPPAASNGAPAKGLGALTAPLAGKKAKQKPVAPAAAPARPAAAGAAAGTAPSASAAARSLSRSPFASPPRGRPRHLGLILTVILLLCLALVAAWSSLYLASAEDPDPPVLAAAGDPDAAVPGIEDEMLADAQEPGDLQIFDPEAEAEAAPVDAAPVEGDGALAEAGPAADAAAVPGDDMLAQDDLPISDDLLSLSTAGEAASDQTVTAEAAEATVVPVEAAPETGLDADAPPAVALLDAQDEIFIAGADAPPPAFDALSLPAPESTADALPPPPMPPPPPGTVYRFGADGLIEPTPEGLPTPGDYMLYAGKPALVPPSRSAVAEAAAAEAATAAQAAADQAAAEAAAATAEAALDAAAETPGADAAVATEEPPQPVGPEAQPNPELADRRPRERPAELTPATAGDDAALTDGAAVQFASLRPRERPPTVLAAGERARAETAGASLASPPAEAVVEPAVLSASDAANPSLLAISRRPAEKPADFSRAVEAAVAAAVRMPDPEPEPEPTQTAAARPKADVKPDEQSEIDEPEVVAKAAPQIPTKASVAKQATFKNALNLSKTNLIGVYGTQSNRYALIRQSNGRYKKVKVGDRIDGGTIQAITQNEVRYQKGGRLVALAMPKG